MAHSLAPATATAITIPISTTISKTSNRSRSSSSSSTHSVYFQRVSACSEHGSNQAPDQSLVQRRIIAVLGFGGAALGLNIGGDCKSANAAAKRPPPPPPTEKKDPNVSGVTAKILASKKRKEAMKEEVAKLRERGKAINEP